MFLCDQQSGRNKARIYFGVTVKTITDTLPVKIPYELPKKLIL